MHDRKILSLMAVAAIVFLVTNSASASDNRAGSPPPKTGFPTFGPSDNGAQLRRSLAPQGLLTQAGLDCDATGLGGGTCPTLQHCMNSCAVIYDIDMVFCATVGMPWIGQCIINASDRWAQCRRNCSGDYG